MPEVPTPKEAQPPPGCELDAWFGLWAPAGTPAAIVQKLNVDVEGVRVEPAFRDKFTSDGNGIVNGSPQGFADWVRAEAVTWGKIMKDSRARVEQRRRSLKPRRLRAFQKDSKVG